MSFEDLIASLGEAGDSGESRFEPTSVAEANTGLFRLTPIDADESLVLRRPTLAQARAAPVKAIRPIRPLRPGETDELVRLVKLCGSVYQFTEAEHHAALAAALADPDSALTCYSTIAAERGLNHGTQSADQEAATNTY